MIAKAHIGLAIVLLTLAGCAHMPTRATCAKLSCGPASSELPAGIYPTIVSPYTCEGVDSASLQKQIDYQLCNGVHGLVVLGTIGEGHILNETERGEIINTAVHTAKERVPVVVGIHACNVQDAIAQMQQARALGTTAVLVKYHGNPRASQRQVIDFYTALSDANILPILVYHFPSDTGIRLSPATVRAILCLANVIGIKESTLNLQQVAMHMKACHDLSKLYFSSTALDLTQFMNMGGHGAICPEAVILPRLTVECYQAIIDGRGAKARDRQKELFAMLPLYRQQIGGTATISRAVLMTAFDARLPLPIGPDASPVRLKEALNYLDVPTPTFAKPGEDALTRRDARQVRRTMAKVAPLAN